MAAMSDYLEANLLNHIFRGASLHTPTDAYFALFTAAPSDSGGGTEVSSSGTNYARKQFTRQASGSWNAAASGAISNSADITFNTPSGAWGTVTHWAIFDNSSGGNMLFWGALTTQKVIGGTDPAPKFAAGTPGAFVLTMSGVIGTAFANAFLDWLFRAQTWGPSFGTDIYVSLHSADPGGTGASEFTVANGYARAAVTRTPGASAGWGVGGANTAVTTGGAISNNSVVQYSSPSGGNWGTATDAGVWSSSSGGSGTSQFMFKATMTDKTVNDGDAAPYMANNACTITIDN